MHIRTATTFFIPALIGTVRLAKAESGMVVAAIAVLDLLKQPRDAPADDYRAQLRAAQAALESAFEQLQAEVDCEVGRLRAGHGELLRREIGALWSVLHQHSSSLCPAPRRPVGPAATPASLRQQVVELNEIWLRSLMVLSSAGSSEAKQDALYFLREQAGNSVEQLEAEIERAEQRRLQ